MTPMQQLAALSAVVFATGIFSIVRFSIEYRNPEMREHSWPWLFLGGAAIAFSVVWAIVPIVHAWDLYVA